MEKEFDILLLLMFMLCGVVYSLLERNTKCTGTITDCKGIEVCVGGEEGITSDEFLRCITVNGCNTAYRYDTCGKCDENPQQYPNGSQHKDCNGTCWDEGDKGTKPTMDKCGVCGGDGGSCDPVVESTDVVLVSDTDTTELTITGKGFDAANVQIVIYQRERYIRSVKEMAQILNVASRNTMKIAIHKGLAKGIYMLGVRLGTQGHEYNDNDGTLIYIYSKTDFTTVRVVPSEVNLDRAGDNIDVVINMEIGDDAWLTYTEDDQMFCKITDDVKGTERIRVEPAKSFDIKSSLVNVTIGITVPDVSTELWFCPTINQQECLGRVSVKVYQLAPVIVNGQANFAISENVETLTLLFNMPVDLTRDVRCTDIFDDVSKLGDSPQCRPTLGGTEVKVTLGDSATIKPGDTLTLKAGLRAATGAFRREMGSIEVKVTAPPPPEVPPKQPGGDPVVQPTIASASVTPTGYWPSELNACASSPITLGITTTGRYPELIIWEVNSAVQENATGKVQLDVDVSKEGQFAIVVNVTDFLGATTSISHVITKTSIPLPYVTFVPQRLQNLVDGQFAVHPNTVFGIGTSISYVNCLGGSDETLESFHFNWTRNNESVVGKYNFQSSVEENTIDMCGDVISYKLTVIRKSNTDNKAETSIDVKILCRNPVARILGSSSTAKEVSITYSDTINIDGRSSYDPDGGELLFSWTCQQNGQDCMESLGLVSSESNPALRLKPSKLTVGQTYIITLVVDVTKKGGIYRATTSIQYKGAPGNLPTVQIITLENNFRHNVRILMKANITLPKDSGGNDNNNVTASWRFVPDLEEYEWMDLARESIGKANILPGFTWYTILPNVLSPGFKYKMQVRVSMNNNTDLTTTQDHDIYIYKTLRICELEARDVMELEKTTLVLQGCVSDPTSTWVEAKCKIHDIDLPPKYELTFTVPVFKDRSITRVNFTCKVRDSLGHVLTVVSNAVSVSLVPEDRLNAAFEDRIADEKSQGKNPEEDCRGHNAIEELELRKQKIERDGFNSARSDQREVVRLLKKIRAGNTDNPSSRNLKRAITNTKLVEPNKLSKSDKTTLAVELSNILEMLSKEDGTEQAARLTQEDIKGVIKTANDLAKSEKKLMTYYRDVIERTTCIQMKTMKNDETEVLELEDGARQIISVTSLDDASFIFNGTVEFSQELKSKFRGLWQCTESTACDDVGLKTEEYPSDPPDLLFDRLDKQCSQYTTVDFYNPKTCKNIPVKDNKIEIKIKSECKLAKCWYYQDILKRFDDKGVVTTIKEDGSTVCQTNHLTMFTLKSEPSHTTAKNIPLLIAAVCGTILCAISLFILLKAYCVLKMEKMKSDDAEEKRLQEADEMYRQNRYTSYNNSMYDGY